MKRRLLAVLLALVAALSLAGCGTGADAPTDSITEGTAGAVPIEIEKSLCGNPIGGFDEQGLLTYGGDPSALVDGDTVYLYVGHDTAPNESYVIPEYLCYSTQNMVNWKYEGVVLSMKDVSWADNNSAWAGQVVKHYDETVGKELYYFYFCSWASTDSGKQSIGVAISESPTGPFVDIGEPVVKGSFTSDETSAWNDIDPTVWIETDETGEEHRYLCWGNSKVYICELNADMVTIKDYDGDGQITFRNDVKTKMVPTSFTEAAWIYRRQDENGQYYGKYYIFYAYGWREQMAYATTGNLMDGKWMYEDVIMKPSATSNTNHPAVIDFQGKTYFIYHNGSLPKGSGFRRVACVEEVTFYPDGAIAFMEETATGISGIISTITAQNGESLTHAWFNNGPTDDLYPYVDVLLGSGLDKAKEADSWWEIVPGKADPADPCLVSIESYNKAGLYVTAGESTAVLSQDYTGDMDQAQTFRTVSGLSGSGVSFESVSCPGMYLTLSGGVLTLTDGADAAACSFTVATVSR